MAEAAESAELGLMGGPVYMDTVPIVPPRIHPEWQGSISSKWMDSGSGLERGLAPVRTYCRNGYDGIARQGLGSYFTDPSGMLYHEGRRHVPPPESGWENWQDREVVWRPSRKVSCVPPNTLMKEQLTAKEKLTDHLYVRNYEAAERLRMRGLLKSVSDQRLAHSLSGQDLRVRYPHDGPTCTDSIQFGAPAAGIPDGPLISSVDKLREHRHGKSTRYAGFPAAKHGQAGDGGAFALQELPTTYKYVDAWAQGPNPPRRPVLFPAVAAAGLRKSASLPPGKLSHADQRAVQMVKEAEQWEQRIGLSSSWSRPPPSGQAGRLSRQGGAASSSDSSRRGVGWAGTPVPTSH